MKAAKNLVREVGKKIHFKGVFRTENTTPRCEIPTWG
jgi:hypothetical protein